MAKEVTCCCCYTVVVRSYYNKGARFQHASSMRNVMGCGVSTNRGLNIDPKNAITPSRGTSKTEVSKLLLLQVALHAWTIHPHSEVKGHTVQQPTPKIGKLLLAIAHPE